MVLLIEDDPDNVACLEVMLSRVADEVIAVASGSTALWICRRALPALIVLDLGLPGEFDGFEVLRILQSADRTKGIPVIVTTGFDDPDSVARACALGAAVVVSKPFEPAKFLETARSLASGQPAPSIGR